MDKELKDQRIPIMMTKSEIEMLDDWMFWKRIRSRGEAIRQMCQQRIVADKKMIEEARLRRLAFAEISVSEGIREMRISAKMTQAELADAIGASQGSVSKWEAGTEVPGADYYLKIQKVCAQ